MSSGPRFVVLYTKEDGSQMEVWCSTKRGAEDWKTWVEKTSPNVEVRVEQR